MTLTSNDSSVLAASSIEGALPIAGANPVDLILLDSAELPLVDRRLCHLPSQTQPGRNIPVVVLSHDPSPEHREHCLAAGAGDVLPRPFSPLALIETVERMVGVPDLPPPSTPVVPPPLVAPTPARNAGVSKRMLALMVLFVLLTSAAASAAVLWLHESQTSRTAGTATANAVPDVVAKARPGLTTGYREESLGNRPAVTTDTAAGAMQEFLRLLRVGEAATAYHWLSPRAQQALPEPDYLAKLGYAGSTSLLGGAVRVVAENGVQVTVSADVLVSRPVNGAVQSQWQIEEWRVVKTTGGWRLDERLSVQMAPQYGRRI